MRRQLYCFLVTLLTAWLLAGCAARPLMRMRVQETEGFRVERLGAGFVEGTICLEVDNRNGNRVIFDAGRIDLRADGRSLGTIRLRSAVAVERGKNRVEVPVRIRFGTGVVPELLRQLRGDGRGRKTDLRMAGDVQIVTGRPLRTRTVRFDRRVEWRQVEEMLGGLFFSPGQ